MTGYEKQAVSQLIKNLQGLTDSFEDAASSYVIKGIAEQLSEKTGISYRDALCVSMCIKVSIPTLVEDDEDKELFDQLCDIFSDAIKVIMETMFDESTGYDVGVMKELAKQMNIELG